MISTFFIEHPIFANVIAIVTIVIGVVCLYQLPVAQYPQIVPPTIQVTTTYPGASADIIANTVGIPIEQAVNGVKNSIYMSSTSSSSGNYTLTVTFAVGTDLDTSLALVQNYVNGVMAQLPSTVQAQGRVFLQNWTSSRAPKQCSYQCKSTRITRTPWWDSSQSFRLKEGRRAISMA